jgi:membrane protease YdiL (CAAX protease family)
LIFLSEFDISVPDRMNAPLPYLLLCFLFTWMVWIPGTLLRVDQRLLMVGSAGPLLAALLVARGGRNWLLPGKWWWLPISFLAIPAYLVVPAAIAHFIGMPVIVPPHSKDWGALAFARNFFLTAVLEEPGWRGTLLAQLQKTRSPLVASLMVWFPWMLWHAPLDLTGGAAHSLIGWLQIRVIFLIPMTILLTWIYNRSGGSLLCTCLFHAALNTFPFVLPYSAPMLGLVFAWVIWVVVQDRMWGQSNIGHERKTGAGTPQRVEAI